MDCAKVKNKAKCKCTYNSCSRKGECCACVEYHRSMGEVPGCFFPQEAEKTYDRSYENFIRSIKR